MKLCSFLFATRAYKHRLVTQTSLIRTFQTEGKPTKGDDVSRFEKSATEPKTLDVGSYMTIRKYIDYLKTWPWNRASNVTVEHGHSSSAKLVKELQSVWYPFCLSGKVNKINIYGERYPDIKIYKNSSLESLDVEELLSNAKQSPFGRGTETVTDTSVRNSFEIEASKLIPGKADQIAQRYINIADLCPGQELELRPYKLVIYKEGGHFHEHRDTVRGEGHIGTLVVVLNSAYTGGELEVTHGGRTETVTGAYSWVAMYGDCLHKINPVTSGTRVSLIYDIHSSPAKQSDSCNDTVSDVEETQDEDTSDEDEQDEDREFWSTQRADEANLAVRSVPAEVSLSINEAVQEELKTFNKLIITLQHLYPECQTSPAFLKGGDRALYDLLSQHYDVRVVAATIHRAYDETDNASDVYCDLFSPSLVAEALLKDPRQSDSPSENEKQHSTKIVIPNYLLEGSVLDYTPYIEHTGNETQAEETVYIVAGLQVRKRV